MFYRWHHKSEPVTVALWSPDKAVPAQQPARQSAGRRSSPV